MAPLVSDDGRDREVFADNLVPRINIKHPSHNRLTTVMKFEILSFFKAFRNLTLAVLGLATLAGSQLQADMGVAMDGRLKKVRLAYGCRHSASYYEQQAVQYLIRHGSRPQDIKSDRDTYDGYYCLVFFRSRAGVFGAYFGHGSSPDAAEAAARNLAIRQGGATPSTIRVKARWHDDCRLRAGVGDQEFDVTE